MTAQRPENIDPRPINPEQAYFCQYKDCMTIFIPMKYEPDVYWWKGGLGIPAGWYCDASIEAIFEQTDGPSNFDDYVGPKLADFLKGEIA